MNLVQSSVLKRISFWSVLGVMAAFTGHAHGQGMSAQYRGTSTFSWVSNISSCTGSTVCWHTLNGTGVLNAAKVFSRNGRIVALDASGNAYTYNDYPANSWTHQSSWGAGSQEAQYDGNGVAWSLRARTGCPTGSYGLYQWTGSAWSIVNSCFQHFSVAADGGPQFLLISDSGTLWISNNSGTTVTTADQGHTYLSVSSINSGGVSYVAVRTDNTVWTVTGSTWTQVTGVNALQASADAQGTTYVLGTDGYIREWNGSSWSRLSGSGKTFLANGGSMQIFAIGTLSGGNSVYRFPDQTVQHARNISGNTYCAMPCTGVTHTAYATAGWGSTYGSTSSQSVSPPTNSVNVSSYASIVDPFTCFEMPGTSACNPSGNDNVHCSQVGNFFSESAGGGSSHFETAIARSLINGFHSIGNNQATYSWQGGCTSPPDLTPPNPLIGP
jgi:hypothetical protein